MYLCYSGVGYNITEVLVEPKLQPLYVSAAYQQNRLNLLNTGRQRSPVWQCKSFSDVPYDSFDVSKQADQGSSQVSSPRSRIVSQGGESRLLKE